MEVLETERDEGSAVASVIPDYASVSYANENR